MSGLVADARQFFEGIHIGFVDVEFDEFVGLVFGDDANAFAIRYDRDFAHEVGAIDLHTACGEVFENGGPWVPVFVAQTRTDQGDFGLKRIYEQWRRAVGATVM